MPKWEMAGAGFKAALGVYQQIYQKDNLGPSVQTALSSQTWQTVQQGLMPGGKLGIDLDGSWVTSTYLPTGPKPWPQYTKALGVAAMPTQNGQGPGHVSLSGGWLLSVGSHATNKQMAFNFVTHRPQPEELAVVRHPRWPDRHPCRCGFGALLQGPGPVGGHVLLVRALHALPPGLFRLPEAVY